MADQWTVEQVAAHLEQAADTARRLPPVRVQGHFNSWPVILRAHWEVLAAEDPPEQHFPPSPVVIDQMLETMRWVQWLKPAARHLVWIRARGTAWSVICKRTGYSRTTAWRKWQAALVIIANNLNEQNRNCA